MKYSSNNETTAILNTLHYSSLLSTQILSINLKNDLQIIETSLFKQRNTSIPLSLIDPEPVIKRKPDNHILFISLISLLISGALIFAGIYANQLWALSLSTILVVFSIMALLASYKNSTTLYYYRSKISNTPLFLIQEPFPKVKQVDVFIKALNNRVNLLNKIEQHATTKMRTSPTSSYNKSLYNDGKKSEFMKHLDFLFKHGVIDNDLHNMLNYRINQKISNAENRFSVKDKKEKLNTGNIIQFPITLK